MEWIPPEDPVDEDAFREALEHLVSRAHQNGVPIEREWACRPAETDRHWVVEIVRLARQNTDDGA